MNADITKRRNLGRGLEALFQEEGKLSVGAPLASVPIELITPSPLQPRRRFSEAHLAELSQSIKEKGILQPLLVRPTGSDGQGYELVAGERRWRAAQRVGVHEVPVIIVDFDDREVLEVALVENLQRADLNPVEEGSGYQRLMDDFGHTQVRLAQLLGKSRSHIANTVRLLGLPGSVKNLLEDGALTAGHCRALIGREDAEGLARRIVAKGLSVRQTEQMMKKRRANGEVGKKAGEKGKSADTVALEKSLEDALGLSVTIGFDGVGGRVSLAYKNLDQLDDIVRRLTLGGSAPRRQPGNPFSESTEGD